MYHAVGFRVDGCFFFGLSPITTIWVSLCIFSVFVFQWRSVLLQQLSDDTTFQYQEMYILVLVENKRRV